MNDITRVKGKADPYKMILDLEKAQQDSQKAEDLHTLHNLALYTSNSLRLMEIHGANKEGIKQSQDKLDECILLTAKAITKG